MKKLERSIQEDLVVRKPYVDPEVVAYGDVNRLTGGCGVGKADVPEGNMGKGPNSICSPVS